MPKDCDDEAQIRQELPKKPKVVHNYMPSKNFVKLPVVRKMSPIQNSPDKKINGIVFP